MTEFSMLPWETQTGTGDGAFSYDQNQANNFFRDFHIHNLATAGPLYGIDNQLAVTGSASPLSVDTGKAYSYGRYLNDAVVNLAVATPAIGDTGGRVVLRTTWLTNTIRAAVLLNTDGNNAIPALTQTAGTTWEISLASFVIDVGGNIWTDSGKGTAGVTDTRQYVIGTTTGMVKLREAFGDGSQTYTFSDIQQDLTHLVLLINARTSSPAPSGKDSLQMTFNGVTAASYDYMRIDGIDGVAPTANLITGANYILIPADSTGSTANYASASQTNIPYYTDNTFYKTCTINGGWFSGGVNLANIRHLIGWFQSTNPITSITLKTSNINGLDAGSVISLYGYK